MNNRRNSMRNVHIQNSYKIWNIHTMKKLILYKLYEISFSKNPEEFLNRSYKSMYIEWILHNIGYYITLPFIHNDYLKNINNRCKHVDLNKWE